MNNLAFSIALLLAAIPMSGQNSSQRPIGKSSPFKLSSTPSYKDPNLRQQRIHTDRSTANPEGHLSGTKTDAQLDKMEHQTNQILSQSAPKQKTFIPKYQPTPEKKTASAGFEQTMPVHAQGTGLRSSGSRRTNEPARAKSSYSKH